MTSIGFGQATLSRPEAQCLGFALQPIISAIRGRSVSLTPCFEELTVGMSKGILHQSYFQHRKDLILSRPLDVLGAPASNAGDEFHEAWALGNALKLLDPATGLTELTVEGVRDAAETNNSTNWDGVDCALYFDNNEKPENSRVEFIQLKYSVTGQNKSWTLARFCTSTKKTGNNSVARRLADAFKGAIKGRKPRQVEASLSIKLVTNQPIAKKLQGSIWTCRAFVPPQVLV